MNSLLQLEEVCWYEMKRKLLDDFVIRVSHPSERAEYLRTLRL